MKNVFNFDMNELTYVTEQRCPQCGGEMRAWIIKDGMKPRGGQVCMSLEVIDGKERWGGCHYRMQLKKEAESVAILLNQSMEQKAYGYLVQNSIVPNEKILGRQLDGFITQDRETKQALDMSDRKSVV